MNLQPIPQSASSWRFMVQGLGAWELGRCIAPALMANGSPAGRECGQIVLDDGLGYADLDGRPFKAYVCYRCAPRLLERAAA